MKLQIMQTVEKQQKTIIKPNDWIKNNNNNKQKKTHQAINEIKLIIIINDK